MTIMELRKQLRDKDMKLTDIRLEALSSAHQLEQLREAMNKMKVRTSLCVQMCCFLNINLFDCSAGLRACLGSKRTVGVVSSISLH